jgi:16S rRNA C1402 (ribose-2'-O) methylase RsmI
VPKSRRAAPAVQPCTGPTTLLFAKVAAGTELDAVDFIGY